MLVGGSEVVMEEREGHKWVFKGKEGKTGRSMLFCLELVGIF